jgi:hypothetical protein
MSGSWKHGNEPSGFVTFEVVIATTVNIAVFLDVTLYNLVQRYYQLQCTSVTVVL